MENYVNKSRPQGIPLIVAGQPVATLIMGVHRSPTLAAPSGGQFGAQLSFWLLRLRNCSCCRTQPPCRSHVCTLCINWCLYMCLAYLKQVRFLRWRYVVLVNDHLEVINSKLSATEGIPVMDKRGPRPPGTSLGVSHLEAPCLESVFIGHLPFTARRGASKPPKQGACRACSAFGAA